VAAEATRAVARKARVLLSLAFAVAMVVGCGRPAPTPVQPVHAPRGSSEPFATPSVAAPSPTAPASQPSPATLAEGIRFTWSAGYTPPAWLPVSISTAPPAPAGGGAACGTDPSGQYTALIRFDPSSPAGAITIQVNGYHGPGSYANTANAFPVDVEVSPPSSALSGLSGFDATGAAVTVAGDGKSGTVSSTLESATRAAAAVSGTWRCG